MTTGFEKLDLIDRWGVTDRWWTDEPVRRLFVELEAPDGSRCVVSYDVNKKEWKIT